MNASKGAAILCLGFVSACGLTSQEKQAVSSFGTSASSLGKAASDNLTAMRDGSVQLHLAAYTADPKFPWPNLKGSPTTAYDNLLVGKFTPDRLSLRQQAATVLSNYGDALTALVSYDPSNDLQSAAQALGSSIKGLPAGIKVISDADADVLASLVQQLGGLLVEQMRADAVRKIVPIYNPQVKKLCMLLGDDLDPTKGELAADYLSVASQLRTDLIGRLDREGERLDVRRETLPALNTAETQYQWARNVLPVVASAGTKCASAADALLSAVNKRQYSWADLVAFAQQVQALYEEATKWK
jgi:hypothetical protein